MLYLPLSLRGDRDLRVGRRLLVRVTPVTDGVGVRSGLVPAGTGRPALRVVVYESADRPQPSGTLLWIHGGGIVLGAPERDHALCSRLAAELGIVVVSPDCRLAPEHPFPATLEDCHAALSWLHDLADTQGEEGSPPLSRRGPRTFGVAVVSATAIEGGANTGNALRDTRLRDNLIAETTALAGGVITGNRQPAVREHRSDHRRLRCQRLRGGTGAPPPSGWPCCGSAYHQAVPSSVGA